LSNYSPTILRIVGNILPNITAQNSRRHASSTTQLWNIQIL